MAQRFALLVGVDFYPSSGVRRNSTGEVACPPLRGCVNDVSSLEALISKRYPQTRIRTLCSSQSLSTPGQPKEPSSEWPTLDNIRQELGLICHNAKPGDYFLFHFSGHGSKLPRVSNSPTGRSHDPALLPADFCLGQPALLGWELNRWLRRIHKKSVRVVVTLDSCYAGGAWRRDTQRRFQDFSQTFVLPTDEKAALNMPSSHPADRGASLAQQWSINPMGFTLVAACKGDQSALEGWFEGRVHGVFTYHLINYIERNSDDAVLMTYCTIRNRIAPHLQSQTPEVYGQDKYVFFSDRTTFLAMPLVTRSGGRGEWILPIGSAHGVLPGTELITCTSDSQELYSVHRSDDFECRIRRLANGTLPEIDTVVVPLKWNLGEVLVGVSVDCSQTFRDLLLAEVLNNIVGTVELASIQDNSNLDSLCLRMAPDGRILIQGPMYWLGHEGPVRGWKQRPGDENRQAFSVAMAIVHLHRFRQILRLKDKAMAQQPPFSVQTLDPYAFAPAADGRTVTLTIANTGEAKMYYVIINLSPGFNAKQLFPTSNTTEIMRPGEERSFPVSIKVPDELREGYKGHKHRDILRVVVTNAEGFSFKACELANIWDLNTIPSGTDYLRHASLRQAKRAIPNGAVSPQWWIKDVEIFTSS
jgi:hypothetical protein